MHKSVLISLAFFFLAACSYPNGDHRKYSNHSYCAQIAQKIQADDTSANLTRSTAINQARDVQQYQQHGCDQAFDYDNKGYVN